MAPRPRSPRGSGEQLADEIIAATTDLLMELGSGDAVSIRAVAQRVGVTPPSIYLHFQDKDALLDAVCAHYYERFDDVMMAAGEGIDYLWKGPSHRGSPMSVSRSRTRWSSGRRSLASPSREPNAHRRGAAVVGVRTHPGDHRRGDGDGSDRARRSGARRHAGVGSSRTASPA
ncbi:hypothetical protein nbrc107696_46360 [Gordonia spumicola]|uniref:HTH tetR-type domain-containing protein n=1 Tax=Gordonia spumicola TaxID=589161 RepID=A0A7I9VGS1_9ACTN|nr:TetR/AcrR family transcriptional regulator [Gordonia spumicola]GEE04190.1 hypothetical protein nbrc107696_46360 [Gordonia spumicola]